MAVACESSRRCGTLYATVSVSGLNNNKKPRVSVVMTAYDHPEFIPAAIDSVLAQDIGPCEVIVVDDGSSADVEAVVAPYRDRLRFIRQPNAGLAAARNTGLWAASGEYMAFCDADDIHLPYRLSAHAALLDRHPDAAQVFSDLSVYEDGRVVSETTLRGRELGVADEPFDELIARSFPPPRTARDLGIALPEELADRNVYCGRVPQLIAASHVAWGGASMYRRAAVVAMGGHEPSLRRWPDWYLASKLAKTYELVFLDAPVLLYRQHGGQLTKQSALGAKAYRDVVYGVWKSDPVFAAREPALLARMVLRAALRHAHYAMQAGDYDVARAHLVDVIKVAPLDRRGYTALARNVAMDALARLRGNRRGP